MRVQLVAGGFAVVLALAACGGSPAADLSSSSNAALVEVASPSAPPAAPSAPPPVSSASAVPSLAPTDEELITVRIHPGEAFFVLGPPPAQMEGMKRGVVVTKFTPEGVLSEWMVRDDPRTLELAREAALRDPAHVSGVLWFAEKPGAAQFEVVWTNAEGERDPRWSRTYDVVVTKR